MGPQQKLQGERALKRGDDSYGWPYDSGLRASLRSIVGDVLKHTSKAGRGAARRPTMGPAIPANDPGLNHRDIRQMACVCRKEFRRHVVGPLDHERVGVDQLPRAIGCEAAL